MAEPATSQLLLGTHVSIAGGMEQAFSRAGVIGATAIQVFTRNASRWQVPPLSEETVAAFRAARKTSTVRYVAAHSSYLLNLASPDPDQRQRSILTCLDELDRCRRLGIESLVIHPGSHKGEGVTAGLTTLCRSFEQICRQVGDEVTILLENTAGQGHSLGASLDQLAWALERLDPGRFGVCLDTCHAFAAGYDISTSQGYEQLMELIDRLIGIDLVQLFHLNDSKKPLGSRVDRHEHVGQGLIGVEGFRCLMQDQRFADCPKIIETPPGESNCYDLENLALLRHLAQP
ncbi:MAG: deoxyribonuclease IV [Desulfuromonadales bacterium]|nr:deoxyribonuclease IV [Desulfuromonadales bacterium]